MNRLEKTKRASNFCLQLLTVCEDARFFSEVHSKRMRGNEHKLHLGKCQSDIRGKKMGHRKAQGR